MSVEIITSQRLAKADQIVSSAMSAARDFAEVFVDLSGVHAPVYIPGDIGYLPTVDPIEGLPEYPDDSQQVAATAALAKIDDEVDNLEHNVLPPVDAALDGMQTEVDAIIARLAVLNAMADNIVIPAANDFMFAETDFRADNDLDAVLKAIITAEIRKGGEGYSATAEAAAYERDQERREIARQESIDAGLDEQALRGFSMPQGSHLEVVTAANEKYRMDDRKLSKDVMLAQSKLSLDNKWKAIDAGIGYNQIIISFYDGMAQRALEAATTIFSITLDSLKYRVQAALKQLEIGKAEVGAIADGRRAIIERYAATIHVLAKKIDGLITQSKGYITAYRTDGQIFGAGIEAAARESRLLQGENTLALEVQKANITSGISAAKNALHAYLETAGIRLGSARAQADMQKANAMGALESLDTVVQLFKSGQVSTAE